MRLAEVGFLFILLAGAWLASAQVARFRGGTLRMLAGVAFAVGGVLLIIAIHWAHFG
jgi:hypothetical protein